MITSIYGFALEELLIEIFEGWVFLFKLFPIFICLMGVGSFETIEREEWGEWKEEKDENGVEKAGYVKGGGWVQGETPNETLT